MSRRRRAAAALAAAALVACGGDDRQAPAETGVAPTTAPVPTPTTDPATTTTGPGAVDGLRASIDVNRLFALEHALGLGLQNVGETPLTVVQIQIESPLFETVPPADEVVALTPGLRELVMPVPYGAPRCDGDRGGFTAVVRLEDGRVLRVDAPERHRGAVLRLHERECAAVDVRERVDLRLGEGWTRQGTSVRGELLLAQRHPGPPVEVTDISGSVIFGFVADDADPIVAVSDEEPVASAAVTISAARCDPHGLGEAKRAFVFVAWLSVGGEDAVAVDVPVEGAARVALDALLVECLG